MATLITVTGRFTRSSGQPARGRVVFVLTAPVRDTVTDVLYPATERVVELDGGGAFSTQLVATDDADLTPQGAQYRVTEILDGEAESYFIEIPEASPGGTVSLNDLSPVDPVSPTVPSAHIDDTTDVHGIDDTSALALGTYAFDDSDNGPHLFMDWSPAVNTTRAAFRLGVSSNPALNGVDDNVLFCGYNISAGGTKEVADEPSAYQAFECYWRPTVGEPTQDQFEYYISFMPRNSTTQYRNFQTNFRFQSDLPGGIQMLTGIDAWNANINFGIDGEVAMYLSSGGLRIDGATRTLGFEAEGDKVLLYSRKNVSTTLTTIQHYTYGGTNHGIAFGNDAWNAAQVLAANLQLGTASGALGFYGSFGTTKGSVTGSRGGNAALASLITYLANRGLLTDGTSA